MLAVLQTTWEKAVPRLRDRVGAAVFDAWFAGLEPLALERGVVLLQAPTRMACERVARNYADQIAEVLSAEIGTSVAVRVEARPEAFRPSDLEVGPTRPVVDDSNKTAFLALSSLVEGRELPSNLFFFYGPPGVGKSFLLSWWRGCMTGRIQAFDGPQLVKVFQAALQEHRVAGLREELARPLPLVIDEVHRIGGHRRIQLELVRVLEARRGIKAPTLITSRWHPREIWRLEPTFEAWLLSGFVAQIDLPTASGRLQYLRALEGKPSQNGRAHSIEDLARRVRGSYPEVRGAWNVERARPNGRDRYWQLIDPRSLFTRTRDRVAEALDVDAAELEGASQRRRASLARKIVAWACVQEGLSRAEVGRFLGGRTRAAISYSLKSLEKDMADDVELRRRVEGLT